mmetsp:Transcript_13248/g.39399  ORF Transcript_13248/g.39399 Transcript_13248/m.39399 type:complete len:209 (-) Transcript_13248:759-1385(-)
MLDATIMAMSALVRWSAPMVPLLASTRSSRMTALYSAREPCVTACCRMSLMQSSRTATPVRAASCSVRSAPTGPPLRSPDCVFPMMVRSPRLVCSCTVLRSSSSLSPETTAGAILIWRSSHQCVYGWSALQTTAVKAMAASTSGSAGFSYTARWNRYASARRMKNGPSTSRSGCALTWSWRCSAGSFVRRFVPYLRQSPSQMHRKTDL